MTEQQWPWKNEDKTFSVLVVDYTQIDETDYPNGVVRYDQDYELEYREEITDLALPARKGVK